MTSKKQPKDPIAAQIGARIKQARQMAGLVNQASLNEILVSQHKWSTGRLGNYEAGQSRPGIEEARILAQETGTSECWLLFGSGPIRSRERDLQAVRHQNLSQMVEMIKPNKKAYKQFLKLVGSDDAGVSRYINDPFRKIGERKARVFEKVLDKPKGWLDEQHIEMDPVCSQFPDDIRELMMIYSELDPEGKEKLLDIARVVAT